MIEGIDAGAEGVAQSETAPIAESGANPEAAATDADPTQEAKKTGNPRVDDPWPDSARKAMNRVKQERSQARYELQQLKAELAKLRETPQPTQTKQASNDGAPKEDDFDNYGEFLKAQMRWEMKQELQQSQQQQQEQFKTQQQQQQEAAWENERIVNLDKQATELEATNPEFKALAEQHSDVIAELMQIPAVRKAALEAEKPAYAFFALAKEGKLEALANMKLGQAAAFIAKAEVRGEALLKQKPVTNAPSPMAPVKGTGSATEKPYESRSGAELLKWVRS